MPASQNVVLAKGRNASAAITKKRFVKVDTADTTGMTVKQCDAQGEDAVGVAMVSVSSGEITRGKGVPVQMEGIAIVEASGALAIGVKVTTGTAGKAEAALSGDYVLGQIVSDPAAQDTDEVAVLLTWAGIL